jgi:CDP-glucose 4,6-dehydratase
MDEMNLAEAFRGRRVLVTGHTGFKGSWLALWLEHLGAQVSGYALPPPTTPSNFVSSEVANLLVRETMADVRDLAQVQGAVSDCKADVIFHLAAQTLVRRSYADARTTFEINVMGVVNVLEAVRKSRRPCVVIVVTSDKCYENATGSRAHRETDALGGHDPYSASKASVEIVTQCYRKSFFPPQELARHGVKVASARAGNAIGGGDWSADRIVTDTVMAVAANRTVAVRNRASSRPWQHVLDPLCGYLTLAGRLLASNEPKLCSAWNFGPDSASSATVQKLVKEFLRTWAGAGWEDASAPKELHEEQILRLCNDRAREELGWRPRWDFEESVRRTAAWYKAFYAAPAHSTRDLCLQDIVDYESAARNEPGKRTVVLEQAGTR